MTTVAAAAAKKSATMTGKMTKGTVAIGAGVLLLLGGAGTYALWEVTAPLSGSVQSGDLNLALEDAAWAVNGAPVADIAGVRIVPGDVVTLTQDVKVTAVGENLNAQLRVDESDVLVNPDVAAWFDVTLDLDANASWATKTGAKSYAVTSAAPGTDAYEATAVVTLTFDHDTTLHNAVNTTIDFSEIDFVLEQLPTAP